MKIEVQVSDDAGDISSSELEFETTECADLEDVVRWLRNLSAVPVEGKDVAAVDILRDLAPGNIIIIRVR